VGDGERLAPSREPAGWRSGHPPVAQLPQHEEQPALPGQ
jgi:hypothetical protein